MSEAGSIISSLNAGSGIDWGDLAENLASVQFQLRTENLLAKSETLEARISSASSIKNSLSTLASSLGDRVRNGDLASKPLVANSSVATASRPAGSTGSGSYSLEVTQLADSQALSGPVMASATDPVGAGTLTIRFGTISGGSFTADAGRDAVYITIASGSSLTDIAAAINGAGSGVTAYVAQTAAGPRLMMKGEEGAANAFVIEATETPGEEGLAALAWEPVSGDPTRITSSAADALFVLDGLEMTSASNDTGQIAPGLSLNLTGTNIGAPTGITFSNPADNVSLLMADLVGALNEIAGEIRTAMTPNGGELASDSGARSLRQRLANLAGEVIMPTAASDAPRTLADLGLKLERDGTFSVDTARLQATLERDPQGVAEMFTTGLYGVYSTVDKLARKTSSSSDPGSLAGSIARYESQVGKLDEMVSDLAEQQEKLRQTLIARFAKTETAITRSQSTLSFLQSQIDAWNASNN